MHAGALAHTRSRVWQRVGRSQGSRRVYASGALIGREARGPQAKHRALHECATPACRRICSRRGRTARSIASC
eukprot:1852572-Pleurochrysis_carterae.AAC.6